MKIEKREITLNEVDSLKDIYYIEKALLTAYVEGENFIVRKETENEVKKLMEQAKEETERIYALWQKSKKEQEQYT